MAKDNDKRTSLPADSRRLDYLDHTDVTEWNAIQTKKSSNEKGQPYEIFLGLSKDPSKPQSEKMFHGCARNISPWV